MAQQSVAAETMVLKVGCIDSLTGVMSGGEQPSYAGAKLAAAWINYKGGITVKGVKYKIELISEDPKSSPEGAIAACTKLIEKDKVKFILGGVITPINVAANSVTGPAGVLRVGDYTIMDPEEADPLTFYTNSTVQGMKPMLTYLKETYPQVKTLVASQPGDGGEKYRGKILSQLAKELDLTVLINEGWPLDTVDFTPFIQKLISVKPDAFLFTDGWAVHAGAQTKVLRGLGYKGPIMSTDSEIVSELLAITGPQLGDGYASAAWDMTDPHMKPIFRKEFLSRAVKSGNTNPWQAWGWNNVWILAQAIESAQSLKPADVGTFADNENRRNPFWTCTDRRRENVRDGSQVRNLPASGNIQGKERQTRVCKVGLDLGALR
jgi:branched-chain amino acid transport system substrate-binding protein